MENTTFTPPQRRGMFFQLGLAALFALAAGALYYRAAQMPIGVPFMLMLVGAFLLTFPVPFLLYGAYALQRAAYTVTRDRVVLQWGWWVEEIPMSAVHWAQTPEGLAEPLPRPRPRWPGMVVGTRTTPEGKVTFMASVMRPWVVIATDYGLYVLSPTSPEAFLRAFRHAAEAGVLAPAPPRFQRPAQWLTDIWRDHWARALLLAAWAATAAVMIWSNLAASRTAAAVPASATVVKAIFLAIAAWLFQGINLGLGLFAYQSPNRRAMAYLIWLVGVVAAVSFLASMGWMLRGGSP